MPKSKFKVKFVQFFIGQIEIMHVRCGELGVHMQKVFCSKTFRCAGKQPADYCS